MERLMRGKFSFQTGTGSEFLLAVGWRFSSKFTCTGALNKPKLSPNRQFLHYSQRPRIPIFPSWLSFILNWIHKSKSLNNFLAHVNSKAEWV